MSLNISSTSGSAPVSFTGIASGIDSTSIIQAEEAPQTAVMTQYQNEVGQYTNANTAWQTILNDLQALGTQADTLNNPGTYEGMSVESSTPGVLTASASQGASAGSYVLTVSDLAQAQESVGTGSATDPTALNFGTGSVVIQVGTGTPVTVAIGADQNSLDGIASAIDAANAGVTAQVAETGDGTYQMIVTGNATGQANGFTITDGLSGGSTTLGPFTTFQPAQDAQLTLGSGSNALSVSSASNSVGALLPGVSLTLLSTGTSTVTVSPNASQTASAVENFVSAYNQLVTDVNTQNSYNSTTDTPGGPLFGNPLLDLVSGAMSDAVLNQVSGAPADAGSLESIGVTMNSDGTLTVDPNALQAAIQQDPQGVQTLLQGVGQTASTTLSSLDDPATGAVTQQVSDNNSEITTLNTTISNMQAQQQQETLIYQQEFAAMEQTVAQNQQLLTLLAGEAALLDGSSSSTSSVANAANAANGNGSSSSSSSGS